MMMTPRTLTLLALAATLAGCPAQAPRLTADDTAVAPVAVDKAAPTAVNEVDPTSDTVLGLKLGMTAADAVAAVGPAETSYPDFMAWHGGRLTANLDAGKVISIHLADDKVSIKGFHIGDPLSEVKRLVPDGTVARAGEVPVFLFPGGHAWLQYTPSDEEQVVSLDISKNGPDLGDQH